MAELRPVVPPPLPVEVLRFPVPANLSPAVPAPAPAVPFTPVSLVTVPAEAISLAAEPADYLATGPADYLATGPVGSRALASPSWANPGADALGDRSDEWPDAPRARRVAPATTRRRHRRVTFRVLRLRRVALVTVLLGLIPIAGGVWFFHYRAAPGVPPGSSLSDAAIAIRVGLQPGDLPGWKSAPTEANNVFAAGATTAGPLAASTAAQSATEVARCLHVPVSALDGAFGMGVAAGQQSAQVASPLYADPSGNGGGASSVVDVVRSSQAGQADAQVFADPSLFATCYQPYVQAMLPYHASPVAPGGFATATVQPVVVPVPYSSGDLEVAAFQIARIANDPGQTATVVTTAVAVFGGRVQATLGTVSNFVFPLDAENQIVRAVEVRVVGVDQY